MLPSNNYHLSPHIKTSAYRSVIEYYVFLLRLQIHLGPSEYLIKVSGTIGSCFALSNLITSLTFVTNAASYGPFGEGGGDPFVFPVQSNSSVVGFFGRAGAYIDAIGFYVRPL